MNLIKTLKQILTDIDMKEAEKYIKNTPWHKEKTLKYSLIGINALYGFFGIYGAFLNGEDLGWWFLGLLGVNSAVVLSAWLFRNNP